LCLRAAQRFEEGTAYVTFDGHMTGDMKSYLAKTTDFGKTWQSLVTADLKGYAHVIREDLVNSHLLFLGTEFGLFASVDGGRQWGQFTAGLPNVPVRDLAIIRGARPDRRYSRLRLHCRRPDPPEPDVQVLESEAAFLFATAGARPAQRPDFDERRRRVRRSQFGEQAPSPTT
jgi:hypothetical protein